MRASAFRTAQGLVSRGFGVVAECWVLEYLILSLWFDLFLTRNTVKRKFMFCSTSLFQCQSVDLCFSVVFGLPGLFRAWAFSVRLGCICLFRGVAVRAFKCQGLGI